MELREYNNTQLLNKIGEALSSHTDRMGFLILEDNTEVKIADNYVSLGTEIQQGNKISSTKELASHLGLDIKKGYFIEFDEELNDDILYYCNMSDDNIWNIVMDRGFMNW